MDSLTYHAGLRLKRDIEATGRSPSVAHYLVAAMLLEQENTGAAVDIEQMYETLVEIANYDRAATQLDRTTRNIREIGY